MSSRIQKYFKCSQKNVCSGCVMMKGRCTLNVSDTVPSLTEMLILPFSPIHLTDMHLQHLVHNIFYFIFPSENSRYISYPPREVCGVQKCCFDVFQEKWSLDIQRQTLLMPVGANLPHYNSLHENHLMMWFTVNYLNLFGKLLLQNISITRQTINKLIKLLGVDLRHCILKEALKSRGMGACWWGSGTFLYCPFV